VTHIVSYSLRNPDDPREVYGDEIADEADAVARARQLAGFYRRPVEVCRAALGHTVQRIALIEPGPTAPPPLVEPDATDSSHSG
jgi:hypothetical protein